MAVNGGAKLLVGVLSSVLVTLIASYIAFGAGGATIADVQEVRSECKSLIGEKIEDCEKMHAEADAKVEVLERTDVSNQLFHQKVARDIKQINTKLGKLETQVEESPAKTAEAVMRALDARDNGN